jgi:hypothetical protein
MELKTKKSAVLFAAVPVVLLLMGAASNSAFAWGPPTYGPYGGIYGWHHYWGWHHFGCGWGGGNGCGSPCAYSYCGSPSPCDNNCFVNSGDCGSCGGNWADGCGTCGEGYYPSGLPNSYNQQQEQEQSTQQNAQVNVYGHNLGTISVGQSSGQSALAGLPHLIGQGLCNLGISCAYAQQQQGSYGPSGYGGYGPGYGQQIGYGYGGQSGP